MDISKKNFLATFAPLCENIFTQRSKTRKVLFGLFIFLAGCSHKTNVNTTVSKSIRVETEDVVSPALDKAKKMLEERNKIEIFALFFDTLKKMKSIPLTQFGNSAFTDSMLDSIASELKDSLSKGNSRMIAIVGEGEMYKEKYHPGIPRAILIRVLHKETQKKIDLVYPFTSTKKSTSEEYNVNIKQGLRFFVD